jgi:hypothetical protein
MIYSFRANMDAGSGLDRAKKDDMRYKGDEFALDFAIIPMSKHSE